LFGFSLKYMLHENEIFTALNMSENDQKSTVSINLGATVNLGEYKSLQIQNE
jgi:hypothetical protein